MDIRENETLISLDFNFSSSGGSHSVSVQSVLKAKDLSDSENELGTLIGSSAGRTTFSNEKIQNLMKNFIEVEKTVEQDGNRKTINRKYQDITSLKLKSHCFVVRGRDCHPQDKGVSGSLFNRRSRNVLSLGSGRILTNLGSYNPLPAVGGGQEVTIPYFSELPNSPITNPEQKFPFRGPRKIGGGVIAIGNIYNEESSVNSAGEKTSLVYQDGKLKERLSFNEDRVNIFYKNNPDLGNYDLNFGYTLQEAKRGFAQAGIALIGLPESSTDEVLFSESGTLDSIASSIASRYGYYWFVDPFSSGSIKFVNSSSSSQLPITNPFTQSGDVQKNYLSASFTENKISPKIVNAFGATIEKQTQTFEFETGQRYTRFHKLRMDRMEKLFKMDISLIRIFYGLYISGKFDSKTFDAIAHFATYTSDSIEWGEEWEDSTKLRGLKQGTWGNFVAGTSVRRYIKKNFDGKFNLELGTYVELGNKRPSLPSTKKIYNSLKDYFDIISSSVFVSNKFSRFKARRMQWGSSAMSISGPYNIKETKIEEVDDLQTFDSVLKLNGFPNKQLSDLFDNSDSSGSSGDYGFLGIVKGNQRQSKGKKKQDIDYEIVNEENFIFFKNSFTNINFMVYTQEFEDQVKSLIRQSISAYNKFRRTPSDIPNTIKATYTRVKRPTDEPENDETKEEEEDEARRQAGLDAAAEKLSEISERFDIRYFNLKTNGASGDPLNPITLDTKYGKIADIKALEVANFGARQSNVQTSKSSSRTIVGLSLPSSFSLTLSALSIRLGASGVTTTIQESTSKLLKPDEQLIISSGQKASLATNVNVKFSAKQKNFFGL